jgi:hypothetical protein
MDRTNAERQRRYIARLKAKATTGWEADAKELAATLDRAIEQLRAVEQERDRYKQMAESAAQPQSKIQLSLEDYKKLVRRMHPDRWAHLNDKALTAALTEASQVLEQLFASVKEETRREQQERLRQEEQDLAWRKKRGEERLRRKAAATRKAKQTAGTK